MGVPAHFHILALTLEISRNFGVTLGFSWNLTLTFGIRFGPVLGVLPLFKGCLFTLVCLILGYLKDSNAAAQSVDTGIS